MSQVKDLGLVSNKACLMLNKSNKLLNLVYVSK
jgi:hypothetical protein